MRTPANAVYRLHTRYRAFLAAVVLIALTFPTLATAQSYNIIERAGHLVRIDLNGDQPRETDLTSDAGIVAAFGTSVTGHLLFGRYADDGMSLYVSVIGHADSAELIARRVVGAQWSPDGDRLLFYNQSGDLFLRTHDGEELLARNVVAASFSPDGRTLALIREPAHHNDELTRDRGARDLERTPTRASSSRGPRIDTRGIYVYDLGTRVETLISTHVIQNYWFLGYSPAWSPDGSKILFLGERQTASESFPFWIASTHSMTAFPLQSDTPLPAPVTPLFWSADGQRILFGAEVLDDNDQLWSVDFTTNLEVTGHVVASGRPLISNGTTLVMQTRDGLAQVNSGTLNVTPFIPDVTSARTESLSKQPVATAVSVYDVKYCRPLTSFTISSYMSHDFVRFCDTSGGYKYDCSPNGSSYRRNHKGTDFAIGFGTPIYAGASGIVSLIGGGCGSTTTCTSTSTTCNGGQGNYVNIKHPNGAVTRYMHMSKTKATNASNVTYTTVIGYVGSTGESTGCHVHFQVDYSGVPVDPFKGTCSCSTQTLWTTTSCAR